MNMQVLILIILLFHVVEPYSLISDPSLLKVLFGNVTDMSEHYLFPLDEKSSGEESETEKEEDDFPNLDHYFKTIDDLLSKDEKSDMFTQDIVEFNTLSKSIKESIIKPQVETRRKTHADWEEEGYNEEAKKERLNKNLLTFLIHVRFQCDMAIRQRKESRYTKEYRLGYLFNRLRRIKYNQAKIIHEAVQQYKYVDRISKSDNAFQKNIHMLLRWYQKILHLDVDMRDVIDLINDVIKKPVPKKPKEKGPYDY